MFNSQLRQIVTPDTDTWQTTRFAAFARQSRVEVNTQRDLEDMLAKLEVSKGPADQTDIKISKKQRRKFGELAIPGLCLALLCVVYCAVYLVNHGMAISHGQQMRDYLDKLTTVDAAFQVVVSEMQARTKLLKGDITQVELDRYYSLTNYHIHTVLPSKSTVEWRLVSKIQDHRKLDRLPCLTEHVMRDVLFYSEFEEDLNELVLKGALTLEYMSSWKSYHSYERHFRLYFRLSLYTIAVSFFQTLKNETKGCNLFSDTTSTFVTQFGVISGNIAGSIDSENITTDTRTLSAELFNQLDALYIHNRTMNISMETNPDTPNFNKYYRHLQTKSKHALNKIQTCFEKLEATSKGKFILNIVYFVLNFSCVGVAGLCVYMFGVILKYESRLVVGVTEWLVAVTTDLEEQRKRSEDVLKLLVPRVIRTTYDLGVPGNENMIPYDNKEATLFMCSLAKFETFFAMFTSSQTLHILTLVMELLDERMAQYNVFPVTKMGNSLIVMSDYVERRHPQHACEIANLALDIMTCCSDLEIGRNSMSKLQMKIGIHSGPNCGMFTMRGGALHFQITGVSLAILQKVHKTAIPNRTQMTDSSYKLLSPCETYSLHIRGNIQVQNLPKVTVYWLDGRRVSSGISDNDSVCSRIGSWIEFERKPLYRLDEEEGTYEPIRNRAPLFSQMSPESFLARSPAWEAHSSSG